MSWSILSAAVACDAAQKDISQALALTVLAPFSDILAFKVSSESIHLFFSVPYVMASIYLLLRNRAAVMKLRNGFKIEDVEEILRLELSHMKPCLSHRCINPEAALESVVSRSTYRE